MYDRGMIRKLFLVSPKDRFNVSPGIKAIVNEAKIFQGCFGINSQFKIKVRFASMQQYK